MEICIRVLNQPPGWHTVFYYEGLMREGETVAVIPWHFGKQLKVLGTIRVQFSLCNVVLEDFRNLARVKSGSISM